MALKLASIYEPQCMYVPRVLPRRMSNLFSCPRIPFRRISNLFLSQEYMRDKYIYPTHVLWTVSTFSDVCKRKTKTVQVSFCFLQNFQVTSDIVALPAIVTEYFKVPRYLQLWWNDLILVREAKAEAVQT